MTKWLSLILVGVFALSAQADTTLDWNQEVDVYLLADNTAELEETVNVELRFVSVDDDEYFAAGQIIIRYDNERLTYLGLVDPEPIDAYPCEWMASGFPPDSGLDGLNNDLKDGLFWYHVWADPTCNNAPPLYPPWSYGYPGHHITTLQFKAVDDGWADIDIYMEYGQYTTSGVPSAIVPGADLMRYGIGTSVLIYGGDDSPAVVPHEVETDGWWNRLREFFGYPLLDEYEYVTWGSEG